MQSAPVIDLLQTEGVWDSIKQASQHVASHRGTHASSHHPDRLGVVSASDWAAALAAAIPDYEKRGKAVLNIAGAIDADILDLVFKKVCCRVGVATLCVALSLPHGRLDRTPTCKAMTFSSLDRLARALRARLLFRKRSIAGSRCTCAGSSLES